MKAVRGNQKEVARGGGGGNMKKINWNEKFKDKECQLCKKKTKEKISFMVGGCVTYVHKSCLGIVENYKKLLLKWEKQLQRINTGN